MGQDEEKAPQRPAQQSLIFTQSGRRDLNPRPPEPHSGALPGCATSRYHNPQPRPVNSQQAQTHRRTVGVQRRVSRTNCYCDLTPRERNVPPWCFILNAQIAFPLSRRERGTGGEDRNDSPARTGRAVPDLVYLIVFVASSHVTAARRKYASFAM